MRREVLPFQVILKKKKSATGVGGETSRRGVEVGEDGTAGVRQQDPLGGIEWWIGQIPPCQPRSPGQAARTDGLEMVEKRPGERKGRGLVQGHVKP